VATREINFGGGGGGGRFQQDSGLFPRASWDVGGKLSRGTDQRGQALFSGVGKRQESWQVGRRRFRFKKKTISDSDIQFGGFDATGGRGERAKTARRR